MNLVELTLNKFSIILLSVIMLATACGRVTEIPEPPAGPEPSYTVQPEIPMYEQLLLKGDVKSVTDYIIRKNDHRFNDITRYGFDEEKRLTYYYSDGRELGCNKTTKAHLFWIVGHSYAFFSFPNIWKTQNLTTVTYTDSISTASGEILKTIKKEINYKWNDQGRFTEIKVKFDGEETGLENVAGSSNIAEHLYDENGYPKITYSLSGYTPRIFVTSQYSDFDENGNPLTIHHDIHTSEDAYMIYRDIEYYDQD